VSGPFNAEVRLGSYNLNVLVQPNKIGANEIDLKATAPEGAPIHIAEIKVLFSMPAQDIGPLVGRGRELAHGHWVIEGRQLSVPGEWQLEIVARTGRFEQERTTVRVEVNP
jgi:copper transport protein